MNDERGSSDPLPYTQVDRAVKPVAYGPLASMLGTTPQHALGSLIEFWDLNGDPREIEALILAGKHEVVLTAERAKLRFRIASSKDVEPDQLEELGLLEKVADGYRVRGMSRYFAPVESRLKARDAARIGGLASARARKAKNGSAQPQKHENGSVGGSEPVRGTVREAFESRFGAASEVVGPTGNRPEAADSVHRTSDSGQRPDPLTGDEFFISFNDLKRRVGHVAEHPPQGLSGWFSGCILELNGDVGRLLLAVERFVVDPHWSALGAPFSAFRKQWPKFASEKYGQQVDATKPRDLPFVFTEGKVRL